MEVQELQEQAKETIKYYYPGFFRNHWYGETTLSQVGFKDFMSHIIEKAYEEGKKSNL